MRASSCWGAQLLPAPVLRTSGLPAVRHAGCGRAAAGQAGRLACRAGMGIGFKAPEQGSGLVLPTQAQKEELVQGEYGLSLKQMAMLGLTNQAFNPVGEPRPVRQYRSQSRLPCHPVRDSHVQRGGIKFPTYAVRRGSMEVMFRQAGVPTAAVRSNLCATRRNS